MLLRLLSTNSTYFDEAMNAGLIGIPPLKLEVLLDVQLVCNPERCAYDASLVRAQQSATLIHHVLACSLWALDM